MKIKTVHEIQVKSIEYSQQGIIAKSRNGDVLINYSDISDISVLAEVVTNYYKGNAYNLIKSITLTIRRNDVPDLVLNILPQMKYLCELIKYKRYVKKFKLDVNGPKNNIIASQLKLYSRSGILLPFAEPSFESSSIITSIVLVGMGIYEYISTQNSGISEMYFLGVIFVLIAMIPTSMLMYKEYVKSKIRKALGL